MDAVNEAKELFLKYGGNFFYMDRDGEYQYYKSFGVGKEQEEAWLEEHRGDLLKACEMEHDAVKLRLLIRALADANLGSRPYGHVPRMVEVIRNKAAALDSFSQLLVCEAIARLVDTCCSRGDAMAAVAGAKEIAVAILDGVIRNPVSMAPKDEADALANPWVREAVQPHRIVERAKECLLRLQH